MIKSENVLILLFYCRDAVCVGGDRSVRFGWFFSCLLTQEGDQISMPTSIMTELLRQQAEVPWQFELKLVRRRAPGKFEPVDVPAPPKEVSCCVWNHPDIYIYIYMNICASKFRCDLHRKVGTLQRRRLYQVSLFERVNNKNIF